MTTITDMLREKAEQLQVERRLGQLGAATVKAVDEARSRLGTAAHDNQGRVLTLLDKAGASVDERTGGRYGDTVAKVKAHLTHLVEAVAEQRPAAADEGDTTTSTDAPRGTP